MVKQACPFTSIEVAGQELRVQSGTVWLAGVKGVKRKPVKWEAGMAKEAFAAKIAGAMQYVPARSHGGAAQSESPTGSQHDGLFDSMREAGYFDRLYPQREHAPIDRFDPSSGWSSYDVGRVDARHGRSGRPCRRADCAATRKQLEDLQLKYDAETQKYAET